MKTLFPILLLVSAILGCNTRESASDVSAEFSIPNYPDSLFLPVTIGASEHICELDSGAGLYAFDTNLRQALGKPIGETPISLPDGTLGRAEKFKTPAASIGGIPLSKNALTICYDLSSVRETAGRDIEGIIGLPLFQSHIIQLDFDAHRIVISSPSTSPKPSWGEPIDLAYSKAKLPMVRVEFGEGISEQCVVDTGFTGMMWLSSKVYETLSEKGKLLTVGEIPVTLVTGTILIRKGGVESTKVGSFEENNLLVRDGAGESRIGLNYLRQFRVTFDLPHNRIYFAKGEEFDKPSQTPSGIGLRRKDKKTTVIWVDPDSPADHAGISVNDELLMVANEPITNQPLEEIKWMLEEKADSSGRLNLTIRREEEQRKMELTIRYPSHHLDSEHPNSP